MLAVSKLFSDNASRVTECSSRGSFQEVSEFSALDSCEDTTSVSRSLREDLCVEFPPSCSMRGMAHGSQYINLELPVKSFVAKKNCNEFLLSALCQYNVFQEDIFSETCWAQVCKIGEEYIRHKHVGGQLKAIYVPELQLLGKIIRYCSFS